MTGKRKWSIWTVYFTILLVLLPVRAMCQTRSELEERKNNTQKEIEYTNKLLEETQKSRISTLSKVRILEQRIQLRNSLIASINREIELIDGEILQKEGIIESLEHDLEMVKGEYENLIIHAYRNRNGQDMLMFIMSADNFNQAYKRMKYIQQFTRYRKEQAEMIVDLKANINQEISDLEEMKLQKESLALEKTNENHVLRDEKEDKNMAVNDLKKKEAELKKEIEEKKRMADRLEKEIAAIIAEEASRDRSKSMYDQLTPEEKLISDNFLGNKGKLPWPTERGVITGKYGKHKHPVLEQITVQNDGIDISTVEGAEARALFEGIVSKVVAIKGMNYTVIVRHGNFLTVYQNLVDLRVKKGDKINVKQVLGRVYTDDETGSTLLHIEIWQELTKQNPEDWLSRRN